LLDKHWQIWDDSLLTAMVDHSRQLEAKALSKRRGSLQENVVLIKGG